MVAPGSRRDQTVARRYHPAMRSRASWSGGPARVVAGLLLAGVLSGGCAALRDDLQRAEASYEEARYEDALVWLRDLEDDAPSMEVEMQGRYYYLRGMAEYRMGHRADALHYLAVAREVTGDGGAVLTPQWRQIMDRTLAELTPRGMSHLPPAAAAESTRSGEISHTQ